MSGDTRYSVYTLLEGENGKIIIEKMGGYCNCMETQLVLKGQLWLCQSGGSGVLVTIPHI